MRNQYKVLTEKYLQEVIKPAREEGVSAQELAMGIKVEMEHTNDREKAKKIALQHLAEDPHYYSKLKKAKLEESDKEDIIAGLGELESWVDAPFTPLLEALTKKGYKVTNVEYNFSTNHEEGFIGISLSIPSGLPGMYLMLNGPGVYDDAQGEDPGFDSVTALDIDQTVSVVIDTNKINKPSIDVLPPTYFNPVKNIVTYSIEIGEVPSEVKDRVISEMEAIINTIKQHNA